MDCRQECGVRLSQVPVPENAADGGGWGARFVTGLALAPVKRVYYGKQVPHNEGVMS